MRFKSILVCLLSLSSRLPVFCGDAPMFRGNLQHTGVYEGAGVAKFSKLKWKFHTAGQVISSPAVSGAVVFVGSTDGNLYALDREAGKQKWRFEAKSRITSSP